MLVLLFGSVVAFLGLYAAEAALPRIRRGQVRDALPERGMREAAVRRLRSDRSAYQEVTRLLSLFFVVPATALAIGVMIRAFDWPWPAMGAGLIALCAAVFLAMTLIRILVAPRVHLPLDADGRRHPADPRARCSPCGSSRGQSEPLFRKSKRPCLCSPLAQPSAKRKSLWRSRSPKSSWTPAPAR